MDISIPRERSPDEQRVPLTPAGCRAVSEAGHRVFVESGAGLGSGHPDDAYAQAGATVVWSAEEAFGRAELVLQVSRPAPEQVELLRPGAVVAGLLHLEAAPVALLAELAGRGVSALALELYEEQGERPVRVVMSEIAGRLAPQLAARWLETAHAGPVREALTRPAGRGVLLGGIPGVPAAEVVILGAGTLGFHAARAFAALGAHVTLLDRDPRRLRRVDELFGGRVTLVHASGSSVSRAAAFADVLLGAVLVPGERAPQLVSAMDVQRMRPDAVVLDFSIDEGGCIETSRPTRLGDPVFVTHGVIHCCLPNAPALVARTASHALSHVLAPLLAGVRGPLLPALDGGHPLASALGLRGGRPTRPAVARLLAGGGA